MRVGEIKGWTRLLIHGHPGLKELLDHCLIALSGFMFEWEGPIVEPGGNPVFA